MSTMPVFVSCVLDFRAWLFPPPPNFHNGPSLSEGLLAQSATTTRTDWWAGSKCVQSVRFYCLSFLSLQTLKTACWVKNYDLPLYFVFLKSDYILLNWANVLPNQNVYRVIRVDSWYREIIKGGNLRGGADTRLSFSSCLPKNLGS